MERIVDVKVLKNEDEMRVMVNIWNFVKKIGKVEKVAAELEVKMDVQGNFVWLEGKWESIKKFMKSGMFAEDYLEFWIGGVDWVDSCYRK